MTCFLLARLYLSDWRAWITGIMIGALGGDNHGAGVFKNFPRWGFYHRRGMCEGPQTRDDGGEA